MHAVIHAGMLRARRGWVKGLPTRGKAPPMQYSPGKGGPVFPPVGAFFEPPPATLHAVIIGVKAAVQKQKSPLYDSGGEGSVQCTEDPARAPGMSQGTRSPRHAQVWKHSVLGVRGRPGYAGAAAPLHGTSGRPP
jgi:hypothetical protein